VIDVFAEVAVVAAVVGGQQVAFSAGTPQLSSADQVQEPVGQLSGVFFLLAAK
jgi:hypothetical protein